MINLGTSNQNILNDWVLVGEENALPPVEVSKEETQPPVELAQEAGEAGGILRAENQIRATAAAAAGAAYHWNGGSFLLEQGIGAWSYCQAAPVANTALSRCVQYCTAQTARAFANRVVTTSFMGVSLGGAATLVGAAATAYTVLKVGQAGYNTLVARNKAEQINISPLQVARNIVSSLYFF